MPRPGSGQTTVSIASGLLAEIRKKMESLKRERERRVQKDKGATDEFGDKLDSPGKFIGFLFEEFLNSRNMRIVFDRLNIRGGVLDVEWPSDALDKLCEQMDWYRSTEWIRNKEHAEKIGSLQQPSALMNRIKTCENFRFEKILVISKGMLNSRETWSWVHEVSCIKSDNKGREISIYMVEEDKARNAQINPRYFDMGIYKIGNTKLFIGFLNREFTPPKYEWRLEDESCEKAEDAFERLKEKAEPQESLGKMIGKYFETLE